ncbi:hypothetical protein BC827DRAFT_1175844 [Russula dissimulans]|nr:hypothetical protein BC827DRAFT_1175844 [Russula dissimulans]
MESVADYVEFAPEELESKVVQVCLGLIEGLAYLHKLCIAHKDIKPGNLRVGLEMTFKQKSRSATFA